MLNKISLEGMWDFTFEDGSKTSLPVPGCFDTVEPYRLRKGKGCYCRKVNGSGIMELTCDGLGLRADIFLDDIKVYSEVSAYTPFKIRFDAGDTNEHELKIVCDNTICDIPESEFRSFYDFYGFGGIYREIALRKLPDTTFDYVGIFPDIEHKTVDLHIELFGREREVTVRIDDKVCGKLPGSGNGIFQVPMPQLWSPENPHLHYLHLDCGCDHYECRFGLRKIECHDGTIFLNGQPLKIIGVNRHDVFPDTGAAVTKEQLYRDLQMIKNAGFNMIRGSHYPQSQMMLDIADELGILVWDEILGWENPIDSLTDPEFQRRQCDGLNRMIKSSVNHPCIVLWGFLNEAATNELAARECISKFYNVIRELDNSRPITFASMWGEKDLCLDLVDVISFNTYPGWYGGTNTFFEKTLVTDKLEELRAFVKADPKLSNKPLLISEIGAASFIGDHSRRRWSEEYHAQLVKSAVQYTLDSNDFCGILLWQFCNSPVDDNSRIMMRPRGYNNKGLVDEYRRPKQAWKLFPEILK